MEERNREYNPHHLVNVFSVIQVGVDTMDRSPNNHIKRLDIFLLRFSIIMQIVDMCFDYNIAIRYFLIGEITYFILTICLILIPSLINVTVSKRMQQQNRKVQRNSGMDMTDDHKTTRLMIQSKLYFTIAVLFELAPVIHMREALKYAVEARKCEKSEDHAGERRYYLKMLKEDQDIALLRVFECFLEDAPQLILQLTLMLKHYENRLNLGYVHQGSSIISSFVSMGWAMANYHRSIRLAQQDKSNIGAVGTLLQFSWHFCITVARILSLSVIASIWPLYTTIYCIIHWISMTIWILIDSRGILEFCRTYSRPPHMPPAIKERIYSILFASVIGIVHVFIYVNTVDGKTFWKYLFFYSLCFVENVTSNLLWRKNCPPVVREAWYFNVSFIVCIVFFCLGITAMVLYYTVFHPSKRQRTSNTSVQAT